MSSKKSLGQSEKRPQGSLEDIVVDMTCDSVSRDYSPELLLTPGRAGDLAPYAKTGDDLILKACFFLFILFTNESIGVKNTLIHGPKEYRVVDEQI